MSGVNIKRKRRRNLEGGDSVFALNYLIAAVIIFISGMWASTYQEDVFGGKKMEFLYLATFLSFVCLVFSAITYGFSL